MEKTGENIIRKLKELHRTVEARAGRLAEIHAERLNCKKGCSACCIDEITVFEIEAENIRENHAELLEKETPHAAGKCAFLDEAGACRIYEDRPYVCRTQGLPLRWIEEDIDETVEYRDICPLNEAGDAIEDLDENVCWTIGEFESKLAELQTESGERKRVALRDLFVKI